MHDHNFHNLSVAEVVVETEDSVSIAFEVPADLKERFAYLPGQFLNIRREIGGKMRMRCYSLCSSPQMNEPLRIAVKRVNGGLVSNDLCDIVAAGDEIEAQPPAGLFTPRTLDKDLLLFAGGSGITPVLSILKSALAVGQGRVVLVYANRDEGSIIFKKQLLELAVAHPGRLVLLHWLESVQGLPASSRIAALVQPYSESEVFICGPEPFMVAVNEALATAGFPRERVHLERFVSLPDEDLAPERVPSGEDDSGTVALTVLLDGETHSLEWSSSSKLLDTLLDAGLDAPFSCRVGGCSACMCRVTQGEVKMVANLVLDDAEVQDGWTLACQCFPKGIGPISIEIA